jgi:hypothetical protein
MRIHERDTLGNAVAILATRVNAWFTGRPLRDHVDLADTTALLRSYGPAYRREIRQLVWTKIRSREYAEALLCWRLGKVLLPSTVDRSLVYVPLPIAWRLERLAARPRVQGFSDLSPPRRGAVSEVAR